MYYLLYIFYLSLPPFIPLASSKSIVLQIGLGLVARTRDIIEHLHYYGVSSKYQETRLLKFLQQLTIENLRYKN